MSTDQILALLIKERDKLNRAIEVLQGTPRAATLRKTEIPATETTATTNHPRKRRWSAAMKRAAAERAKAVWAKKRKAEAKG
jgi:hypothetical protein